jgi:hypothetical protein
MNYRSVLTVFLVFVWVLTIVFPASGSASSQPSLDMGFAQDNKAMPTIQASQSGETT